MLEDDDNKAEAFWEDTKDVVTDAWGKFWGGSCATQSDCADYIATCSASQSKLTFTSTYSLI